MNRKWLVLIIILALVSISLSAFAGGTLQEDSELFETISTMFCWGVHGDSLAEQPNFRVSSVFAVAVFNSTSATLTNPYRPGELGDKMAYAVTGTFRGEDLAKQDLVMYYEAVAIETVDSVQCLKVELTMYLKGEKVDDYVILYWVAQDTQGNVWGLKKYNGYHDETDYYGKDNAILVMPASPQVGEQLEQDEDEYGIVEATGVTVTQLSTGLGPYTNCIQIGYFDGNLREETDYYAPGVSLVLAHDDSDEIEGNIIVELKAINPEEVEAAGDDGGGGGGGCLISTAGSAW